MRVTSIVALAACGALLAAAPGASAATLTADQGCYIEGLTMGLTGAGFAPAAAISLAGEQIALTGPAGADGTFQAPVKAPLLGTVEAGDEDVHGHGDRPGDEHRRRRVDVHVATAVFATSTGFKSPRASRTWKFSGLFQQPGKPIYGHFRHNGKTYANYRFGVPQGPCGTLKRKAPGIPARSVPAGKWKVQVDFEPQVPPEGDAAPDRQHDGHHDVPLSRSALEHRQVAVELPLRDLHAVVLPLLALDLDEAVERVLAERRAARARTRRRARSPRRASRAAARCPARRRSSGVRW